MALGSQNWLYFIVWERERFYSGFLTPLVANIPFYEDQKQALALLLMFPFHATPGSLL